MSNGVTCCICGKPLEKEESIVRGMGEVCAGRYAHFKHKKNKKDISNEPQSDYVYHIIEIDGKKVAVIIDKDTTGYMSVTNNIDNICQELGVDYTIYRDSEGIWDFWSVKTGFKSLALHGQPNTNMDSAIEVAKIRFFNIGGLFAGGGR